MKGEKMLPILPGRFLAITWTLLKVLHDKCARQASENLAMASHALAGLFSWYHPKYIEFFGRQVLSGVSFLNML
jgi:hypothetical protein